MEPTAVNAATLPPFSNQAGFRPVACGTRFASTTTRPARSCRHRTSTASARGGTAGWSGAAPRRRWTPGGSTKVAWPNRRRLTALPTDHAGHLCDPEHRYVSVDAASYQPRAAESAVLHRVVCDHLETFLREATDRSDGNGLPRFVERDFRES
jgi:hypothetical protein